jgi:hypothetical protein
MLLRSAYRRPLASAATFSPRLSFIPIALCFDVVHVRTMSERQSVTFSDQAIVELRSEAKRIGISVSDLVRRIVDQWRDMPPSAPK